MKAIPDYQGDLGKMRQRIRATARPLPDYWQPGHNAEDYWRRTNSSSAKFDALWQPLNDRILVRRLFSEKAPSEVIAAPQIFQAPPVEVEVVRCGPGKRRKDGSRERMDARPGDVVIIGAFVDWESFDGQYALCQQADIRVFKSRAKQEAA